MLLLIAGSLVTMGSALAGLTRRRFSPMILLCDVFISWSFTSS